MRTTLLAITVLSLLRQEPCDAGTGETGGGRTTAADGGTSTGGGDSTTLCTLFFGTWTFNQVTTYSAGRAPQVDAMNGTAVFNRDGTFIEDYTVGSLGLYNHYEGTFAIRGKRLTGTAQDGTPIVYDIACSDAARRLDLTIPNADGTPQAILDLASAR